MSDDLISRSALKKEFDDKCAYECAICKYSKDFAPTIDTTCPNCNSGYAQGYSDGYLKGKEERPQGVWTTVKGIEGTYYCSECDGDIDWKSRYCPWCGADMRGGDLNGDT